MEKDVEMPAAKRQKIEGKKISKKAIILPSQTTKHSLMRQRMDRKGDPDFARGGKWILYINNKYKKEGSEHAKLDEAWIALKKLHANGKLLAVEFVTYPSSPVGVICCHTRDFYNVKEVKSAAIDIRNAVTNYHKNIYYKQAKNWYGNGPSLYMFDDNKNFFVLHSFDLTDRILPSKVTNVLELSFGKPDWKKGGKWVLHLDNCYRDEDGLTRLDRAWIATKKLFDENKFQAVECSTAVSSDSLIYCYTNNILLVEEIESTARCIREALPDYTKDINYRMADDRHGKALYKFDKNELFVWDEFDLESFYPTPENGGIPSRVTDKKWISYGPDKEPPCGGKWMLFYNKRHRGRDGLTKLDRVWFKIKEEFPRNEIFKIICSTADPRNLNSFEDDGCICLFTRDYNDIKGVKAAASAIRAAVTDYHSDMYYKKSQDRAGQGESLYIFSVDNEFFIQEGEEKNM